MHRLTVLTNIPTPYRVAFFNTLTAQGEKRGISLEVLYCALREPNRAWSIDWNSQQFPARVLRGVHIPWGGNVLHVNPGAPSAVRRRPPTWLLAAGGWPTPTMLGTAALSGRRGPWRLFWSEGHADAIRHPRGALATLRRRAYALYDGFAVPNDRSAEFVGALGLGRPILPLPNTIDEEFYRGVVDLRAQRDVFREKYDLDASRRLVICVAQLEARKGIDRLVSAYRALPDEHQRRLGLVLVGAGPLGSVIEDTSRHEAGFIRKAGHRSALELRELLAACDAFILPSLHDPNPLASIEASFAELPLLLSDRVGNASELVVEGETGWTFPADQEKEIGVALVRFASTSAERCREMGRSAAQHAAEGFARVQVAGRFLDALWNVFPPRSG